MVFQEQTFAFSAAQEMLSTAPTAESLFHPDLTLVLTCVEMPPVGNGR